MNGRGQTWGVVLAAGEGSRLGALSLDPAGRRAPKQYCALVEERTLLRATLDRMERIVPKSRTVVVVAEAHRGFFERELADWPAENVVVQPENRGTAPGILLPLLAIAGRDAEARVVVTPSDHHVEDEAPLQRAIADALSTLDRPFEGVVLLGIEPEGDGSGDGYGYIVPKRRADSVVGLPPGVARFVEKPAASEAAALIAAGATWSSFVFAARLDTLLALYVRRAPALLDEMVAVAHSRRPIADRAEALAELYRRTAPIDFSRDLLSGSEDALVTIAVAPCGWTDLGTPERLDACRRRRHSSLSLRIASSARALRRPARLAPSPFVRPLSA